MEEGTVISPESNSDGDQKLESQECVDFSDECSSGISFERTFEILVHKILLLESRIMVGSVMHSRRLVINSHGWTHGLIIETTRLSGVVIGCVRIWICSWGDGYISVIRLIVISESRIVVVGVWISLVDVRVHSCELKNLKILLYKGLGEILIK